MEHNEIIAADLSDPFIAAFRARIKKDGYPTFPWNILEDERDESVVGGDTTKANSTAKQPLSWADLARSTNVKKERVSLAQVLREEAESLSVPSDKIRRARVKGIINSGNMCYMNSVLQVLIHCEPFAQLLLRIRDYAIFKINSDTPVLDALSEFIGFFLSDFTNAQGNNVLPKETIVDPDTLYRTMAKKFKHLKRGRQEDAQEFLGYLLQALQDELDTYESADSMADVVDEQQQQLDLDNNADDSSAWTEVGKHHKPSKTTVYKKKRGTIERIFGGQFKSVLEVTNKPNSITYEPFEQVQLDIDSDEVMTLEDALSLMSKPEQIPYRLSNGIETQAVKTLSIDKVSRILIIHLKRFSFLNSGGIQKISKPLHIPKELKFKTSSGEVSKSLFACVYHHGPIATAGHYTVDVKVEDTWYSIDDTTINEIPTYGYREEEPTKSAYLLFYL